MKASDEIARRYVVRGRLVARHQDGIPDQYDPDYNVPAYIRNRRTNAVVRLPRYLALERLQDIRTDGTGMAFEEATEDDWLNYEGITEAPKPKHVRTASLQTTEQKDDGIREVSKKIDELTGAMLKLVEIVTEKESKKKIKKKEE